MENKLNREVQLSPRFARWCINHQDIYGWYPDEHTITSYDVEMQLFLLCLWGVPIKGYTKMQGADENTFGICFHHEGLELFTFLEEKKHFTWLK